MPETVVPVLDKGFLALDAALASDLAVVNGARVSFNQESDELSDRDAGLIRFLVRERHGSPFEHGYFRFVVKAPLFVVREHHRHRAGHSYNEWSGRYSKMEPEFYVPENVQVLLTLAQALANADSTDAAVAEYRRVIELDTSSARAYRGLGLCQIQKKSYGEAVTSLKQATSLDNGNADGWAYLGQAYLGLNDVIHARQAAERCLAINPSHATGQSVLKVSRGAQSSGSTP